MTIRMMQHDRRTASAAVADFPGCVATVARRGRAFERAASWRHSRFAKVSVRPTPEVRRQKFSRREWPVSGAQRT